MLGLVCHFLKEEVKPRSGNTVFVNAMNEKVLQLGKYKSGDYTREFIKSTYIHNARQVALMIPTIHSSGIHHFRLSSALFPLSDQVDRELWDNQEVQKYLKQAGDYVKKNNMRITAHPGQFCVLSSDSDRVVENSFKELSHHGWIFDVMGLDASPFYAINIHGGKADRTSRLIDQIKSLPNNVKNRLTLENDENCYSVIDLLEVYQSTGVPVCFDSHHHIFNDGDLTLDEAYDLSCQTWTNNIKPLQHLSNTEPSLANGSFMDRRKHSEMIHYIPECQLQGLRNNTIDVEVEAKSKNLSIFKLKKDFEISI